MFYGEVIGKSSSPEATRLVVSMVTEHSLPGDQWNYHVFVGIILAVYGWLNTNLENVQLIPSNVSTYLKMNTIWV